VRYIDLESKLRFRLYSSTSGSIVVLVVVVLVLVVLVIVSPPSYFVYTRN